MDTVHAIICLALLSAIYNFRKSKWDVYVVLTGKSGKSGWCVYIRTKSRSS